MCVTAESCSRCFSMKTSQQHEGFGLMSVPQVVAPGEHGSQGWHEGHTLELGDGDLRHNQPMGQRIAVIVAGDVARARRHTGASQRLATVHGMVEGSFDHVVVLAPGARLPATKRVDLAIGVSWPSLPTLLTLRNRSGTTWFDACDSTRMLSSSGSRGSKWRARTARIRDIVLGARLAPSLVTYITQEDAEADQDLWPQPSLVFPTAWPRVTPHVSPDGTRRLVLSGDGRYLPNQHAAKWTMDRLAPELRRAGIRLPIWIYGAGYRNCARRGVHFAGYVNDDQELYRVGDIHLAPMTSGAGMKSKVAVPLLAGLEVVSTPSGFQGLREVPNAHVCELDDFARRVIDLSSRPARNPRALSPADVIKRDDSQVIREQTGLRRESEG